jgi:hypothetical protein
VIFNAKTGKLLDYVETDKSLLNILDLQDDLINYMYDYENIVKAGASLSRNSNCTGRPNTYGHMLLDFCRKNNIYIVNGRVGKDKLIGECTCQDVSMIDYFLSSSKLFFHILDFEIKNFTPNLSSREYEKDLNQAYVKFQSRLSAEIREASSHNPKKFWDILKRCTNAKKSNIFQFQYQ